MILTMTLSSTAFAAISEIEPTVLEQDVLDTDGKDANNNNISFDIKVSDARSFHKYVNGKPISASNPWIH